MRNKEILTKLKFFVESGIHDFIEDNPQVRYSNVDKNILGYENHKPLNLDGVDNIEKLKIEVNNFDKCDLKKNAKNTVFADGNPSSKIMLIGEAPGQDEDIQGIPFVGRAGQLLNKMLASIELSRKHVYISNIVPWRPPGNRQPTTEEILLCLPFIQKHIELINPKLIVLLGGTAAKALLLSDLGIMRLRGKWHEYSSFGLANPILTRAIFHPAFLLRSPSYKKQTWEDLLAIKEKLNE